MTHLAMGAIVTRRTSRHIIAECFNGSLRMAVDYSLRNSDAHATAAAKLVRKLATEWVARIKPPRHAINAPQCGEWVMGDTPKGDGFAFCYVGATDRTSGLQPRGFIQNCETDFG